MVGDSQHETVRFDLPVDLTPVVVVVVVLNVCVCVCVSESPLQFYVNHASSPNVTAYGPGLSYGVAQKMATFTVFTEDASEGARGQNVTLREFN